MSDEIERRTVYIRLLSEDREGPETRGGFRHPKLKEYVVTERGRLVHASLTLARYAYQLREAGLPARGLLGSFEAYDELMGGLLTGIEVPGWMGNREALRSKSTDELEVWRELVYLWAIREWGVKPSGRRRLRARADLERPARAVHRRGWGAGHDPRVREGPGEARRAGSGRLPRRLAHEGRPPGLFGDPVRWMRWMAPASRLSRCPRRSAPGAALTPPPTHPPHPPGG